MNKSCEPGLHFQFVGINRLLLVEILYDHGFILQKFHAQYILEHREYRCMVAKNKLESLLDLLQNKGERACQVFISLLRDDREVKKTFPRLEELDFSKLDSTSPPLGPQSPNSTQRAATPQVGPSQRLRARRPDQTTPLCSTKKTKGPNSLKGHIQNVSELIKTEKSLFFRTQIKTTDQARSVVVFKTEQREEFIKMEKNKSLVLLEGLWKGWKDRLLFNDSSRFTVLDDRLFTGHPQIGVPLVTSDQLLPNKENCEQGKVKDLETVNVTIVGVRLKDEFRCPQHHLLDNLPPSQYVDCRLCDLKYGKADLKRVLSGRVLAGDPKQDLKLTDDHVRSLLKEVIDGGCDTIDQLEIALKEICFLKVTLNHNIVISVSRTSPDASQ